MAAIAFEGLPRFTGYALVTKDYLDSRFNEFETRIEAKMDKRLAEFAAGIDKRFTGMETDINWRFAEIDKRFTEMQTDISRRFAAVDVRFERIDGKFNLVYWMQGMTIACVVIPLIRGFLV